MKTLDQIAIECQTDKSSKHHSYCDIYDQYLSKWRDKHITLIEAGIGGYEYADRGGQSARMWREYFSIAEIITFDIHRKFPINGVDILQGSQDDRSFIQSLPDCDVFVDDASHRAPLTIATFFLIWPGIKSGGLYICEDLETSYWHEHDYGGDHNPEAGKGAMNFFKSLTDQLNHRYLDEQYKRGPLDMAFIHFYEKIVIIGKK